MPSRCSALNCSQTPDKTLGISLHIFPQDPIRRREWSAQVRRDDHGKLWIPKGRSWLCSKHFEESWFDHTGQQVRLRDGAVPTIFDHPAHLQRRQGGVGDERLARRKQRMEAAAPALDETEDVCQATVKDTVLEDHMYCLPEPKVLKRRLDAATDKADCLSKQARNTSDREKRLRETLKSTLAELRDKSMVTAELKAQLAVYSDIPVDLFSRAESAYTQEQRDFALNLYLHGPKAYSFLRESAKIPLPHPRSLRRWLEKVDATPGINSAMISHLKTKVEQDPSTFKNCTLMLDGMAIKQHITYDGSKDTMVGFVDLGNGQTDEEAANDVLVLMVVGTTGHWKAPIAFFLNHGLTATTQAQLVLMALSKLHEAGLQVRALTMDGHTANYGMCAVLGCDIPSGETSFTDPASDNKIFVIFDACHMQKLLRNMLKAYDTISSEEGLIKWSYIEALQSLQDAMGLRLANKLTHRHTYFENCKMKVSVSVQTLSASVATALDFLQQSGHPAFQDVTATVSFIKHVDQTFDILNSRSKFGRGFSAPMSAANYNELRSKVNELCAFLRSLKMRDGTPISKSRRYMCVVGTTTTLRSVMELAPVLFEVQDYVLTYKFSQDHLELFFNAVRRSGGWNNNPNAAQFMATFRHLLYRCGVSPSSAGNVAALDPTSILAVGHTASQRNDGNTPHAEHDTGLLDVLDDHDYRPGLSSLVGNVVCYIAGFVVRRALDRVDCATCQEALVSRQEPDDLTSLYHLLHLKNRGGLVTPSAGTLKVVLTAEEEIRRCATRLDSAQGAVKRQMLESAVLGSVGNNDVFGLGRHTLDTQYGLDNHHTDLIRLLVTLYRRVRLHHQARLHTARLQKNSLRQKLTKLVLFRGN